MISEAEAYIERFRAFRADVLKSLSDLDVRGLNWKPTRGETNSIYVLATHLLGSERHWLHRVVGGRGIERDRDAEFTARGSSADGMRDSYDAVARVSDEILSRLTAGDFDATRTTSNYNVRTVRWCVLHMLEHYAEHAGQMRLTRQLWDARAGAKKASARPAQQKAKRRKVQRRA